MSFRLSCLALFLVALAVRLLHVVQLRAAPFSSLLIGDAKSYDAWARQVAAGDWLGSSVFYQAPLYPYFLASLYATLGDELGVVRVAQALLGAGACVLLADAGRRFFSPAAGLLAGAALALYAPAIFFDGLIQKTSLASFLWCLCLWLLARLESRAKPTLWMALGAALAALVLTRENALVVVPIVFLWLLLRGSGPEARRWLDAAALILGLVAVLGPVTLRNHSISGELHLTTSQLGPNLYIGNNRDALGTYMPLQRGRGDPRAEQADARRLAEADRGRVLSSGEVSDYWVDRSAAEIREAPLRWLGLVLRKFGLAWNATEIGDTEFLEQHAEWSPVLRIASHALHFGWIAPLAVFGLWVTWPQRRRLWLLYGLGVAYLGSLVLFYVMARYRYPLVPLLLLFAAAGLVGGRRAIAEASMPQRASVALLVLASVIVCNLPIDPRLAPRWVADYNLGTALLSAGRPEEAVDSLRAALQPDADALLVHTQLAIALHRAGRHAEAEAEFRAALALDQEFVDAHIGISRVLIARGREEEALSHLRSAGRLAPGQTRPLNNAAWLLATSQRIDERTAKRALRMARRANELAGGRDLMILDTLAAAYAANERFEEAVAIAEAVESEATQAGDDALAAEVSERLQLYRRGERYVAPRPQARESR